MMQTVRRRTSFASAKELGRLAARNGVPRVPPYEDKRTGRGRVTFSRAYRRAWLDGYDEEMYPGLFD